VPGALLPVQAPGGLVADLDDPVLTAFAADSDLPLLQVDVAASQAGQLGQPDAGRGEDRDDHGVAPLGETAARAGLFQPGQLRGGEDGDQLVGERAVVDSGGCSPSIGSGSWSSAASHLKNCWRARYWLLA
jgi:hypothetical protein